MINLGSSLLHDLSLHHILFHLRPLLLFINLLAVSLQVSFATLYFVNSNSIWDVWLLRLLLRIALHLFNLIGNRIRSEPRETGFTAPPASTLLLGL